MKIDYNAVQSAKAELYGKIDAELEHEFRPHANPAMRAIAAQIARSQTEDREIVKFAFFPLRVVVPAHHEGLKWVSTKTQRTWLKSYVAMQRRTAGEAWHTIARFQCV